MISKTTANASARMATGQPCGCTEAGPESCALECIEKPRFSCGQLLTDQDLTALVQWSEQKAGLVRYRHGWGVVCGLDVSWNGQEGQVTLGPGYAVDCCGRDIVVCGESVVSLDPCCKPDPALRTGAAKSPPDGDEAEFAGRTLDNVRVIDLSLHYAELDGSPRPTLGGANCSGTSACENSRTRETFRVQCSIGATEADPVRTQAEQWTEGYGKCLEVVRRFQSECGKSKGAEIQRWLLRWLERNPPHHLCFLKHWITEISTEEWNEQLAAEALFWMVQDCRNTYLQCGCSDCPADGGVPIARVWARMPKAGGAKSKCHVIAVDIHSPYRRPIQSDCWIAPMGSVNAGALIWRRADDAQVTLNRLGLRWTAAEFSMPATPKALETELEQGRLIIPSDSVCKLQILNCGALGYRVVAIR